MPPLIPRMPPHLQAWLSPGENPFTADFSQLIIFRLLVLEAENA